ncbi:hypothetical protein Q3G72_033512 [Acer saccharum]|nr:hypothetical protein Q3G72_033512 [Acer saccharum]
MQVFSKRILNLWSKCEVRVMILLSLVLQIILIIFGNRRKLTARFWIRIIIWSAYLTADWVATVALGNLASSIEDSEDSTPITNSAIQEFWAPFLLLHLGGPDTITAYSLEDKDLWLRHFVGLIIQVGVAFYIFLRSWGNTALTFLTIPIFISGIIKYGERTYALRCQNFKDFLPSGLDFRAEGSEEEELVVPQVDIHREDHYLVVAHFLYFKTKFFSSERTLNLDEQKCIYSIIKDKSTVEAFKMVAVELGFMYDVLYTKAVIVYSRLGIFFRCVTFSCSFSALVVFFTFIDTQVYPQIDISITYLLLVGAVFLELYALILLFLSDWVKLWLIKLKNAQHNSLPKSLANFFWRFFSHSQSLLTNSKRWSECMGQFNLISSCIHVQKFSFTSKLLKNKCLTWVHVDDYLQEKIFEYIRQQGLILHTNDQSSTIRDSILGRRGNFALSRRYRFGKLESQWCATKIDFVDSLIIWNIATDICYFDDCDVHDQDCIISKCLSEYMLYLLVFRPSMLPEEIVGIRFKEDDDKIPGKISEIRFKETSDEIIQCLKKSKLHDIHNKSKACEALLQNYSDWLQKFFYLLQNDEKDADDFNEFFTGESQSLLKYGLMLYMQLKIESERKWKIIRDVWVEMLVYAAHNCGWKEHAQQLRKGGELLTHIFWAPFLLLHLGSPYTITAYSLEDNELWLRHLLGLVIQVGVAFYVFLRSWGNSALTFIAIPIFITGIIKYGERTFVLRSSSAQRFKNSLLSNPDPGPNIIQKQRTEERRKRSQARSMVRYLRSKISRLQEFVDKALFTSAVPKPENSIIYESESESLETGASDLQVAYFLFKRFRYLFADSILGTRERIDSCSQIENKSSEDAFKLIAIELGFMYDLLYTKATIVYSRLGILFRVISFIASVTALVLFSVIIDTHAYSSIDVSITYILLIGAVVLEVTPSTFSFSLIGQRSGMPVSERKIIVRCVVLPFLVIQFLQIAKGGRDLWHSTIL